MINSNEAYILKHLGKNEHLTIKCAKWNLQMKMISK